MEIKYFMKISIDKKLIKEFCIRHHIQRLALFGSVLREDFTDYSDVDVLVKFEKGHTPGFFRLFDIEEELSGIIGRKVDLRTKEDLSRHFRNQVIRTMAIQYEKR